MTDANKLVDKKCLLNGKQYDFFADSTTRNNHV